MTSTPHTAVSHGQPSLRVAAACLLVLLVASSAGADPRPLSRAEQANIDRAIGKGIASLRRSQRPSGVWPTYGGEAYRVYVGFSMLPALTMLECGVRPGDPAIQKTVKRIREVIPRLRMTYDVSVALLLLDRVGDPQDEATIRSLALRLVAGQTRGGGWTYRCPALSEQNEKDLLRLLGHLDRAGDKPGDKLDVPDDLAELTLFRRKASAGRGDAARKDSKPMEPDLRIWGDNSNTQFALLALWAARRHEIPLGPTARLMVKRFESSQGADGGWGYGFNPARPFVGGGARVMVRSMTTVGLLGLAVGHGLRAPARGKAPPAADPRIVGGLARLYLEVGVPTGVVRESVPLPDVYFLWSVERVAALYNLPALGDKDWYRWGAERLLSHQSAAGDWPHASFPFRAGADFQRTYGTTVNTCFALLFLKRTNLVKDLTARLPFRPADLNTGIAMRLRRGQWPAEGPVASRPEDEDGPRKKGASLDATERQSDGVAALADGLVRGPAARRGALLERLRDGKGVEYTEALAGAIPRLEGNIRTRARAALADRLTRMKASTLARYLRDEDAEVRRAAALACARKGSKENTPGLIRLLDDTEAEVARSAHDALRRLSGRDFGPRPNADGAGRERAIAAWKTWWKKRGRD